MSAQLLVKEENAEACLGNGGDVSSAEQRRVSRAASGDVPGGEGLYSTPDAEHRRCEANR